MAVEYEPYGDEWIKEMMKVSKPHLVKMYKKKAAILATIHSILREDEQVMYSSTTVIKDLKKQYNDELLQLPKERIIAGLRVKLILIRELKDFLNIK